MWKQRHIADRNESIAVGRTPETEKAEHADIR